MCIPCAVQDDNSETDPHTNMPQELVFDSGSERRLLSHPHSPHHSLLSHLERLGLRINLTRSSLSPRQRVVFLGMIIDSAQMWAWITPERSLTSLPLRVFQRMLGLMAAASSVISLDLLHMWPLQFWLKACVPFQAWCLGRFYIRVRMAAH